MRISQRSNVALMSFTSTTALSGVTREIHDVRDRVRDIERHLGLGKNIAA